ncbi:MAG: HPF/RaiA family ribosome-associated protein [Deltaproteobacteria bacterium]|nr:HPF/RaiA family ribosome-associated protein [Deltaproteobacteria bacterium]
MEVPLEVTFRNVPKSPAIDSLIRKKAAKLDKVCDHITSCRVAIEKPHEHQQSGNPFRVRIDITIPPGHEMVITRNSGEGERRDNLASVVRSAFDSALRQLKELVSRQRRDIKSHPEQDVGGFVVRVFRRKGYGFVQALDGREIYFHKNSVLNGDFDRMEVGTGVRFVEEEGEKGLQASTVQIVDKPGP